MLPEYMPSVRGIPASSGQLPFYIGVHEGMQSAMHYHRFAEFSYILKGNGMDLMNGKSYPLSPGTASLTLPNDIHSFRSDVGQDIVKYCCMFDLDMLPSSQYESEWQLILNQVGDLVPSHVVMSTKEDAIFRDRLERLLEVYRSPNTFGRSMVILGMLTELIALFLMAACGSGGIQPGADNGSVDELFWSIFRFVNANSRENLTLGSTARHFHISPAYVSKLFQLHVGTTFLGYLHQLRVSRASSLLLNTELRVSEIAFSVGFESLRTFSRVFREIKGATPGQFRKSYRESRKDYPFDSPHRTKTDMIGEMKS